MFMDVDEGAWSAPLCLSMELGARELLRDPTVETILGPIDLSRTQLFIGERNHGGLRVFPAPSELPGFVIEILP